MSLSFEESLKNNLKNNVVVEEPMIATDNIGDMSCTPFSIMTLEETSGIAAYAGDDWTLDDGYLYYPEYYDNNMSIVDNNKNITLDSSQINLTQETNSQFIPFEIPRFYDGFDLQTTQLRIYFVNKNKYGAYAVPINVYYNSENIKFGWLIDKRATVIDGRLQFEIQAVGTNSNGDEYIWKTKPNDELNVLKSLEDNGIVEPDATWVSDIMVQMMEQASIAQTAAEEALAAAEEATSGTLIVIDTTLTQYGQAADAKTVGDKLKEKISTVNNINPDENGNINIAIPTDEHINNLINMALGAIENGSY